MQRSLYTLGRAPGGPSRSENRGIGINQDVTGGDRRAVGRHTGQFAVKVLSGDIAVARNTEKHLVLSLFRAHASEIIAAQSRAYQRQARNRPSDNHIFNKLTYLPRGLPRLITQQPPIFKSWIQLALHKIKNTKILLLATKPASR